MRDVIITSSILILCILFIRHLAKGRIHPLLQYSLWLLVVLKLIIPIPLWSSQLSVLNLFPDTLDNENISDETEHFEQNKISNPNIKNVNKQTIYNTDAMADSDLLPGMADSGLTDSIRTNAVDTKSGLSLSAFLTFIWFTGIIATGGYMIFYQIKWQRCLHINRKPLSALQSEMVSTLGIPLSVYIVKGLPSPCLCGRSIYLTDKMAEDEKQLEHILVHEYCHYRQLDSLWVIVRCVLTVLYWFNPLVWAAAYISKQDSEFACDAAVIRMLGEDERIPYGKTLINLISGNSYGRSKIGAVSMMGDGDKNIRERIFKIAGKPKYIAAAAAVVILIAAVLAAVTFSGEYRENTTGQDTDDATDIISTENEENIENLVNAEDDDMQAKSEQLDEAVKEKEKAMAEQLAEIEEMEAALQAELSAIKQVEAEQAAEVYLQTKAELEEQNAEESAKMEAANQAILTAIEAEENESDLSKPFKFEDFQLLLSQAGYTEPLPHQSAMQISYVNPCPSYTRISDIFGIRIHPVTNIELFHNGVDLAAAKDEDIVAAAGGIVCKTGYDPTNGNHVVIYHGMENFTYYAHCAEILVSEGDRVESGQKIAAVGSTGRSTGPHLHFMVSDNGEYVEPVFQ